MSDLPNNPPLAAGREVVRCAKCDAENLAGASKCRDCGAHLYRVCPTCGRSNVRTRRYCIACSGRIGRSRWQRLRDKVFRRFSPWKVSLALLGLAVLTKLVLMLVNTLIVPVVEDSDEPYYNETVNHGPGTPPPGPAAPTAPKP
jgi:hypothetical protein